MTARVVDESAKYELDPVALVMLIKAQPAGTRFYLRAWCDAPIANEPGRVFPSAICASAQVSRAQAVKIAKGALSETMLAKGARIPCSVYAPAESRYRGFYLLG